MARILYVDETAEWRDAVRQALGDHHVDLAGNYDEAITRLAGGPGYDLTLVDLDLLPDIGTLGVDLLDLLRARHPETRRMAIAAAPIAEATRAAVVHRHRLEDVLIKPGLTDTDLRYAVEQSLDREVSPDARIRRAELRRRYQEWWRGQQAELDSRVRAAELVARNTASAESRRRAALGDAVARRERFHAEAEKICRRIEDAVTIRDTLDAADAFEYVLERWADDS